MTNVYFPAQVVTILKRLANVVSTISISNHYFLSKSDNVNRQPPPANGPRVFSAWRTYHGLEKTHWTNWANMEWSRFADLRGSLFKEASLSAMELTLQWFNTKWPWRSLLTSLETELSTNEPSPPSPKGGNRQSGNKQMRSQYHDKVQDPYSLDTIHKLLQNPALYSPLRRPRYPLVLCHGLYGFDTRGPSSLPSIRMHYWANVLNILRDKLGAEVIVTSVPGTGSISSRSESLDRQLQMKVRGRGVNFLAHSMGGLDCRYLISHIRPTDYVPLSLTTISTPHRGSPFMDWCAEHLGLGKVHKEQGLDDSAAPEGTLFSPPKEDSSFILSFSSLPSSFTTLILSILDSPAYANLTSSFLNDIFNPATPDDPSVKYFSVAGRMSTVSVWHPFWLPKTVLDNFEEEQRNKSKAAWEKRSDDPNTSLLWAQEREWGNDGLVTVQSAKWGQFLGIMEECDHWQMRGARGIEFGVDLPNIYALSPDWSFRDWSRFSNFWTTETKKHSESRTSEDRTSASAGSTSAIQHLPSASNATEKRIREQEKKQAQDDDVVKSSTDKVSAVMDWLVEQAPSTPKLSLNDGGEVSIGDFGNGIGRPKERARLKSELETKEDLERFYIALCRKVYDEGL